ncbi:MAG: outer membrane beta-barrel protein [Flavobacteriaceae bacterium]|nr:outer membrane beta-barrel protein [Flavobacteriaceae bacterium]
MKTKKQLDRLFKEQFRNMEVAPPPAVWENISAALHKKKQTRRVVPLWYKLAGVAAALLVFFSVGSIFYNPSSTKVTLEDTKSPVPSETISPVEIQNNELHHQDAVVEEAADKPSSIHTSNSEKQQIVPQDIQESISSSGTIVKSSQQSNSVTENKNTQIKRSISESISDKDKIAQVVSPEQKPETKDTHNNNPLNTEIETIISDTETQIKIKEENKKSLLDYIAEKNEDALTISNPTPINRWEVAPNLAPVYYSSFGKGSSIDPQFSENSKSGDVNLSYGVKVSYAITEKLSIRTGINKVDLSYSTNDIEFAIASASGGLQSIDSKGKGYAVAVGTRGSLQQPPSNLPTMTEDGTVIVPRNGVIPGTMQQELDYFEVPLELKYSLLNKKFGVNLVGGMSTLFLNNNQVSVLSDGFQTEIGSANNLNNVSFSTNVGLGFDYKLSNRFVFNLEPMFKYQLNPYSDSSIDFKPYYLGVYSGFSYRF